MKDEGRRMNRRGNLTALFILHPSAFILFLILACRNSPSYHFNTMSHPKAATLGQLKETRYTPRTVKDEMRFNLIRKLKAGDELFPGIVGYRDTVIPQIVNGILSRHD